jgi:hypothetical protein
MRVAVPEFFEIAQGFALFVGPTKQRRLGLMDRDPLA